jgi:hypothetical protein
MYRHVMFVLPFPLTLLVAVVAGAQEPKPPSAIIYQNKKLSYIADDRGNRIPDFSFAGYRAGVVAIPTVPVRVVLEPTAGDNTQRLQAAIDAVAEMQPDSQGFRGAILLKPGRFEIAGSLTLRSSGVVLRGSGPAEGGTSLVAAGRDRRTVVRVVGKGRGEPEPASRIASEYVPVGATTLSVTAGHGFRVGDPVLIARPSTKEWICSIGMDDLGGDRHGPSWNAGSRDLVWDRTVTRVDGDRITVDGPITTAIDGACGGGSVARCSWPGRITEAGIENLRLESEVDPARPRDEDHAWCAITVENAADIWMRQLTFVHFAGSAVAVWESAKRVTVEDCKSLAPVSEVGGGRRVAFFTSAQQVLMQRLWSEDARHDFAVGLCAAGPNAFVQCQSARSTQDSGGIDSWSSGTLYDNVRIDGHRLGFRNRSFEYAGAGWSGANSVLWNCHAAVIDCWRPPGAQNWAFGAWAEFSGDGFWESSNAAMTPASLYYAQLAERLGNEALDRPQLMPGTPASEATVRDRDAEQATASFKNAVTMNEWIDLAGSRNPIDISHANAQPFSYNPPPPVSEDPRHLLTLDKGRLLMDRLPVLGGRQTIPWWRGSTRLDGQPRVPALTRFVPGRLGPGCTDDLTDVANGMARNRMVVLEQHPPLWYDRRRDDHERIRRMDGNVVAPFYEWPYARSGVETAWDGLSKFDLTRFNPWYWDRLAEFAELAERRGLVLFHQQYFQHSILEAGAHYADYPWRTANNINHTGFPEPPAYLNDKYIFMAPAFYDVANSHRSGIHQIYIRHCLDSFENRRNVIQAIGEEFTGPLPFVQLWTDTIGEWKREHSRQPLVALGVTKDVQDEILGDARRQGVIDIIDIRYWWYSNSPGDAYMPRGGENRAPRQQLGMYRPKPPTFAGVARAVREYRRKYPGKAVIFSARAGEDDTLGWATLVAGGSMAAIKGVVDESLLRAFADLSPLDLPDGQWAIAGDGGRILLALTSEAPLLVNFPRGEREYVRTDFNPGTSASTSTVVRLGGWTEFRRTGNGPTIVWLRPRTTE